MSSTFRSVSRFQPTIVVVLLVVVLAVPALATARPETVESHATGARGLASVVFDAPGDILGGNVITARALPEGAVPVVRREHQMALPGGSEAPVEIEERSALLADSTLLVETTSKAHERIQTHRAIDRRVQ